MNEEKTQIDRASSEVNVDQRVRAQKILAQIKKAGNYWREKAPRLKDIAWYVNNFMPEYEAEIEEGYCNTDRKIGKLRSPGKGRYGNQIIIRNIKTNEIIIDHNSAETYRRNNDVCEKLINFLSS